jgi:predicted dehydrogenase
MKKTINWGILGASAFALEHMAPAINAARGARLAALATSSAERGAEFVALAPGMTLYQSYEVLLADPSIDAVYVPLPNHMHVEWTLKAVAAGKHVLTEKPIAMQADEIDQLIAARDASGKLVAEAYMIVHHPQWQRARELVQSGAIGTVEHVDANFSYDNRSDMSNIRNRPETGGGGIRDIGVYTYSSVRFVTGAEPLDLTVQVKLENGVDTFAKVIGTMKGPLGRFTYAAMTSMRLFFRQEVVFQGDKGLLRLTAPFNPNIYDIARLEWHQSDQKMQVERWPATNHYVTQVEAFGHSAQTGAPYACSLEFSRGTQSMIDKVLAVTTEI